MDIFIHKVIQKWIFIQLLNNTTKWLSSTEGRPCLMLTTNSSQTAMGQG